MGVKISEIWNCEKAISRKRNFLLRIISILQNILKIISGNVTPLHHTENLLRKVLVRNFRLLFISYEKIRIVMTSTCIWGTKKLSSIVDSSEFFVEIFDNKRQL